MTIKDPRLAQIAINVEEQRQWLVSTTWGHLSRPEVQNDADVRILGIAEQLLQEVYNLIRVVSE